MQGTVLAQFKYTRLVATVTFPCPVWLGTRSDMCYMHNYSHNEALIATTIKTSTDDLVETWNFNPTLIKEKELESYHNIIHKGV